MIFYSVFLKIMPAVPLGWPTMLLRNCLKVSSFSTSDRCKSVYTRLKYKKYFKHLMVKNFMNEGCLCRYDQFSNTSCGSQTFREIRMENMPDGHFHPM